MEHRFASRRLGGTAQNQIILRPHTPAHTPSMSSTSAFIASFIAILARRRPAACGCERIPSIEALDTGSKELDPPRRRLPRHARRTGDWLDDRFSQEFLRQPERQRAPARRPMSCSSTSCSPSTARRPDRHAALLRETVPAGDRAHLAGEHPRRRRPLDLRCQRDRRAVLFRGRGAQAVNRRAALAEIPSRPDHHRPRADPAPDLHAKR